MNEEGGSRDAARTEQVALTDADRQLMLAALVDLKPDWTPPVAALRLGSIAWRPDLIDPNREICHLHTVAGLRQHWIHRLASAKDSGYSTTVAAPSVSWYSSGTLTAVNELDAAVIVLKASGTTWQATRYRSVADLIAREKLQLSPKTRAEIGQTMLGRALSATSSHERGWRFEDFLCLLFSQVSFFEVFGHNLRNDTEEIDVVLVNRRVGQWTAPPSPIVLVTAKNTVESVGVQVLSYLRSQMENRRGQCKLGFLCASRHIASTVSEHEMRFSRSDSVVVLLDGADLQKVIEAPGSLDEMIEATVTKSMLM